MSPRRVRASADVGLQACLLILVVELVGLGGGGGLVSLVVLGVDGGVGVSNVTLRFLMLRTILMILLKCVSDGWYGIIREKVASVLSYMEVQTMDRPSSSQPT